jgi:hypothetical protein
MTEMPTLAKTLSQDTMLAKTLPQDTKKKSRARKTSDVPTRIYSYRCLPPVTEAKRVEDQFRLGHQFRNALVEINQRMWERYRAIWIADPRVGPALLAYQDACAMVDDAYDFLRAAKSGVEDPDLTIQIEHLEAAKALRKDAGEELHAAKTLAKKLDREAEIADPIVGPAWKRYEAAKAGKDASPADKNRSTELRKQLREKWLAARREAEAAGRLPVDAFGRANEVMAKERLAARADFIKRGLRTGTYYRIEEGIKQAEASKRPLHFERYEGAGSIGTQLIGHDGDPIKGMTVSELHSCQDTRVRVAPMPANFNELRRGDRRRAARVHMWLRVGSNPDRSPIFAQFPITMHRPLPKDAVIKWAYVVRRRIGPHYEWRFQLTIESETFRTPTQAFGEGTCAIDLGWRWRFDDEGNPIALRAGYLVDEAGREREILVPEALWRGIGKVYDLAKIRSQNLDRALIQLAKWLSDRGGIPEQWRTPEAEGRASMGDRLNGHAQWKAPRKLQGLIDQWTERRVPGDADIYHAIKTWARQDRHLHSWAEHQRDRLIANRREVWRVTATQIARTYATILIEDGGNKERTMRLPEIDGWERPAPEDGNPSDGREQRRTSRLAAPGELRAEIMKAVTKTGAKVEAEKTANSTRECADCGAIQDHVDFRTSLNFVCENAACASHALQRTPIGTDQDANACRNLLHRHGLSSGPAGTTTPGAPSKASTKAPARRAGRRGHRKVPRAEGVTASP